MQTVPMPLRWGKQGIGRLVCRPYETSAKFTGLAKQDVHGIHGIHGKHGKEFGSLKAFRVFRVFRGQSSAESPWCRISQRSHLLVSWQCLVDWRKIKSRKRLLFLDYMRLELDWLFLKLDLMKRELDFVFMFLDKMRLDIDPRQMESRKRQVELDPRLAGSYLQRLFSFLRGRLAARRLGFAPADGREADSGRALAGRCDRPLHARFYQKQKTNTPWLE